MKDVTDKEWSREQVQLLVKAVTLHPAGTNKRFVSFPPYYWFPCPLTIFSVPPKGEG